MRIGLGGDFFVDRTMAPDEVVGKNLAALIEGCDAGFLNFEGPVIAEGGRESFKTGPNLRQWTGSLPLLVDLGVTGISLANNHAADFGTEGLAETIRLAAGEGLGLAGLASDGGPLPLYVQAPGLRLAILAFAEQEWCGDQGHDRRIALFDPVSAVRAIRAVKSAGDAAILCLHGNNEHSSLPHPQLVETCRFLIESGADAVILHHAHAVSGIERWQGRPILYGLGNFFFTRASSSPGWTEGLFAILTVEREGADFRVDVDLHPINVPAAGGPVDLASPPIAERIENEVAALSQIIGSRSSLAAHFELFVTEHVGLYEEILNPWWQESRLRRGLGRKFAAWLWRPGKRRALLLNALRCDSHRAALTKVLETRLRDNP